MTTPKDAAIAAFIAKKTAIDAMLNRLAQLSHDHFNCDPENIDWGHVGTISSYEKQLREIVDQAFGEGEFAI